MIDLELLGKTHKGTCLPAITIKMLDAFIKVRHPVTVTTSTGNVRWYVPKGNKAEKIAECVEVCCLEKWEPRQQTLPPLPIEPVRPVERPLEVGDIGVQDGGIAMDIELDRDGNEVAMDV